MNTRKPVHITFAALVAAAGLALSACGNESAENAAPAAMTTVTAAPSATDDAQSARDQAPPADGQGPGEGDDGPTNEGAAGTESTAPGARPGSDDDANCGVDPSAAAITDNISQVPAPSLAGMGWVFKGDSNYDLCATLSFATVEQSEQGNSQFQNQLMLFHEGDYLGVGSDTVQQHQVIGTTDNSVTVAYKDYEALEAAGAPFAEASNYTTNVTFRWNGSQVVPEGRFPNM